MTAKKKTTGTRKRVTKSVKRVPKADPGARALVVTAKRSAYIQAYLDGVAKQQEEENEESTGGTGASKTRENPFTRFKSTLSILVPPYIPEQLLSVVETSNILPQCIATMEVNIDGFGHLLERTIEDEELTDDAKRDEVEQEFQDLTQFFKYANFDESFSAVRRKIRRDLESTGNAWMEIIRNGKGAIAELQHVPTITMRMTATETKFTTVSQKIIKNNEIVSMLRQKRFRRYVQNYQGAPIYFKEFGDTRLIYRDTGKKVPKSKAATTPDSELANEMMHFKITSEKSPYGVPRWIGNLISVQGSRSSEELNLMYFINGRHLPMAILVSGGMLTAGSIEKIEEHLEEGRGIENAHKVLILEAEAAEGFEQKSANVRVDMKPLVDMLQQDALFQNYDEKNRNKGRSSFRIPQVLIGESEDYNRSTVDAAIKVANAQVFDVERDDFDDKMNRRIMPELEAKYHVFKSKSYRPGDDKDLATVLQRLDKTGVLTPRTLQQAASNILGMDIKFPSGADWLDRPMSMTTAMLTSGLLVPEGVTPPRTPPGTGEVDEEEAIAAFARGLVNLRKVLEKHVNSDTE